jgi:phasin family protein
MQNTTEAMENMEKHGQKMMSGYEDASHMAREHMDAAIKAATVVGKGMEEIVRSTSNLIQESMTRGLEVGKTMMSAKSMPEAMNCHSEFMKECFDQFVATTGKMSEVAARTAQEAMSPIADQTNNSIAKFTQKIKQAA